MLVSLAAYSISLEKELAKILEDMKVVNVRRNPAGNFEEKT